MLQVEQLYDNAGVSFYLPRPEDPVLPMRSHSSRRLKLGNLADLHLTGNPNKLYNRLEDFIRLNRGNNDTSIYIVDYHQFALYGWAEAFMEGKIELDASLRHFDDHNDAGIAGSLEVMTKQVFQERKWSLQQIVEYVFGLGCWQFIEPAERLGLVGEFIHIAPGHESRMEKRQIDLPRTTQYTRVSMGYYVDNPSSFVLNPRKKIVDIDLDYFVSDDFDPKDEDRDIQVMRKDIASAGVVTLATSPGFIDQERAVELIKKILS